jgi:hypothetical protein
VVAADRKRAAAGLRDTRSGDPAARDEAHALDRRADEIAPA